MTPSSEEIAPLEERLEKVLDDYFCATRRVKDLARDALAALREKDREIGRLRIIAEAPLDDSERADLDRACTILEEDREEYALAARLQLLKRFR